MKSLSSYLNTINECIIVCTEIDGNPVLSKTRDRNYKFNVNINKTVVNGVEVCYYTDSITDWSEGLNEFGISIVNSALLLSRDENIKAAKNFDGSIIREALSKPTIIDALKTIISYKGGLIGNTLITDGNITYSVEKLVGYPAIVRRESKSVVLTNHARDFQKNRHIFGDPYRSSFIRQEQIKKNLEEFTDIEKIMSHSTHSEYSPNNVVKKIKEIWTTAQIICIPRI